MKTVSIIIPSKNEEKFIGSCLDSIYNNDYPNENINIIVCDGFSKDNTLAIVEQYKDKFQHFTVHKNISDTMPAALNIGIKHSQSDYVLVVWAHCMISENYISKCVNFLESHHDYSCVGGSIKHIYANYDSEVIGFVIKHPFGVGKSLYRIAEKDGSVETVPCAIFRREVFEKIGYFDEQLIRNQDDEFSFRIIKAGLKIYLLKDILIFYPVRSDYKKFFKQFYQYGYWKVYVNVKHKKITTLRQLAPFFFVLTLFLGLAASLYWKFAAISFFSLIIIYLLTSFFVTFKKNIVFRKKCKIVFAFAILHISYGLGYMNGVADFIISHQKPQRKMSAATR